MLAGLLAESVFHWIEYQRCIGIDGYINESFLTTPIVACLSSQGWRAKKETDYAKICAAVTSDKCYADFFFEDGEARLVLETKFYRASPQSKIFDDFLRLALPSDPRLMRLALVVRSVEPKLWGQFKDVLDLTEGAKVEIDPILFKLRGANGEFLLEYNKKEFARLREFALTPLGPFSVECLRKIQGQRYAVSLLSVARDVACPKAPQSSVLSASPPPSIAVSMM